MRAAILICLVLIVSLFGQFTPPPSGGGSGCTGSGVCIGGSSAASNTPSVSTSVTSPAFIGSGSDPYVNLPSNTGHSFSTGDLLNNAGVLEFNDGAGTRTVATKLTTSGSSGASTLIAGVLNIPQYAGGGGAMTQIAQTILDSPAATVSFSGIAGTFTNLLVTVVARCSAAIVADDVYAQFNADTAANYTRQFLSATSSSVTAGNNVSVAKASIVFIPCASALAGAPGMGTVQIPSYSGTTFLKVAYNPGFLVPGAGATNAEITGEGLLWANTAAITSIVFGMAAGSNFVAGSTFTIYGY